MTPNIKTWHRNFLSQNCGELFSVYDETQFKVIEDMIPISIACEILDRDISHKLPSFVVRHDYTQIDKPVIVFDVDGVLAYDHTPMQECLDKATNKVRPWSLWHTYNLDHTYEVESGTTTQIMREDSSLFLRFSPCPHYGLLSELRNNFYVVILTARGFHPFGLESTARWLKLNGIEYDSLHVLPLDECKVEYLKNHFGEVYALVEDNHSTAPKAFNCDHVIHSFIVNQPWNNSAITGATRINRIIEIKNYLVL